MILSLTTAKQTPSLHSVPQYEFFTSEPTNVSVETEYRDQWLGPTSGYVRVGITLKHVFSGEGVD